MKKKFEFIYNAVSKAIMDLNAGAITVEQAKAVASLAKQGNNVLATQLDVTKFIYNAGQGLDKKYIETLDMTE